MYLVRLRPPLTKDIRQRRLWETHQGGKHTRNVEMMNRHMAFALFDQPIVLDLAAIVDVMRKRHPGVEIDR